MDNIIELLNIDFSTLNDEFNWLSNTAVPVETVNGQLKLTPNDSSSNFRRGLGDLDPTNDRVRLQMNLDIYRPQTSLDETITAVVGIYIGSSLIDQFSIYMEGIGSGEIVQYNFDRTYKYDSLSGAISMKISTPEGYTNQILLDYLKAYNGRFNENNVRSYFAIDGFFDESFGSISSGVQLLEWKIDDVETLTSDFFVDNPSPGSNPLTEWNFAKSNIDGSNRESNETDPNTFNPFISEWGLTFDQTAGNYFGGKPTGTESGKDYGQGIMTIGFEKPEVLNGVLIPKKGVFFIDIDFSKNLLITFNVLVNDTSSDVFNSPLKYRKYFITWNASTCISSFSYQDILSANPTLKIAVNEDGFLSGLTGSISTETVLGCDQSFNYNGNSGTFEFEIDFGTELGTAGITFDAYNVPDKFELEWNGITYSTGYVGDASHDQSLINAGVPISEIKTGVGTGSGNLTFSKDQATPTTAIIRVTAPLTGTGWHIDGICPDGVVVDPPFVDITTIKTSYQVNEAITVNIVSSGTIVSWSLNYDDGSPSDTGTGAPPATVTKSFGISGSRTITMVATGSDGSTAVSSVSLQVYTASSYQITGTTQTTCSQTMDGTIEVFTGTIVVKNQWTPISGDPTEPLIIINGNPLWPGQTTTLGVGEYPYTSDDMNCNFGSGLTELIVL